MQAACDAFNARFPIGAEIVVFTGLFGENPKVRTIREPGATILGDHTPVVYVLGGGGCIALTHVKGSAVPTDPKKRGGGR